MGFARFFAVMANIETILPDIWTVLSINIPSTSAWEMRLSSRAQVGAFAEETAIVKGPDYESSRSCLHFLGNSMTIRLVTENQSRNHLRTNGRGVNECYSQHPSPGIATGTGTGTGL